MRNESLRAFAMAFRDLEKLTKTIITCILLISATVIQAQQHAPTKAQCDADLNLWRADLITGAQGEWALKNDSKIRYMEIVTEAHEMTLCEAAYMPGDTLGSGAYADLGKVLDSIIETRLIAFMARHPDVLRQFAEEDASGLR
jgi:hypothetical protein